MKQQSSFMNPIRARRIQRQLTMTELSRLTGINYQLLGRIENGHTRLLDKDAEVLGKFFGVAPQELIELYVAWRMYAFTDTSPAANDERPTDDASVTLHVSLYAARLIQELATVLHTTTFQAMDAIAQAAYKRIIAKHPISPSQFQRMLADLAIRGTMTTATTGQDE